MTNVDAIASFCERLKILTACTYTKGSAEITEEMVTSFNHKLFFETCNLTSKTYNAELCNFELIGDHIFKPQETWVNRELVKRVAVAISKIEGWEVACEKTTVSCNRSGKERIRSVTGVARPTQAGPLKTKCSWSVKLKALVTSSYIPRKSATNKLQYKDDWDKPVLLQSSSCKHTDKCEPCRANRVAVTQASGSYLSKLPSRAIYTLCNYKDQGIKLTHQLIKATIKPLWQNTNQLQARTPLMYG